MSNLQGLFYYETGKQRMLLTPELAKFLGIHELTISRNDYFKKIIEIDKHIHTQIIEQIREKQSYQFSYHLSLQGQRIKVTEYGKPYFSKDGILKFYICSIVKEDLKKELQNQEITNKFSTVLTEKDLTQKIQLEEQKANDLNYRLSVIGGKYRQKGNLLPDLKMDIAKILNQITGEEIYFVGFDQFIILSRTYDGRIIERWLRQINHELSVIELETFVVSIKYPKDFSTLSDLMNITQFMLDFRFLELDELAYKDYLYYPDIKSLCRITSGKRRILNCCILLSICKI